MSADTRPVLFVTNHAPPVRAAGLAALHAREEIEVVLFGGRMEHGAVGAAPLEVPHATVEQREVFALAASGRYRAVVSGTAGRIALPAAFAGARRAGVPFVLWTGLWAHPRTAVHLLSAAPLRRIYRTADAVVTYGPHVTAYVSARGALDVHEAPQAVDNAFWAENASLDPKPDCECPRANLPSGVSFMFAGRPVWEKGLRVLIQAWRTSGCRALEAALVLVGVGPTPPWVPADGAVTSFPAVGPHAVRNFYGAADVLVVPSIPTRRFREPWGLVVNEAMNQKLPIIATDAVGAAAGGLVRHERNGLIVRAGDVEELSAAMVRLGSDGALRRELGRAGARDVTAYTHEAWAAGFSSALASAGAGRAS
jgi:glycosyltransferase involved in cell wall biosynthesis